MAPEKRRFPLQPQPPSPRSRGGKEGGARSCSWSWSGLLSGDGPRLRALLFLPPGAAAAAARPRRPPCGGAGKVGAAGGARGRRAVALLGNSRRIRAPGVDAGPAAAAAAAEAAGRGSAASGGGGAAGAGPAVPALSCGAGLLPIQFLSARLLAPSSVPRARGRSPSACSGWGGRACRRRENFSCRLRRGVAVAGSRGQRPLLRAPCRLLAPRSDQVCASPFPTKGESRPESDARSQEGGGPGPRLRARRGAGHGVRSGARTRTRECGERAARAQGASGGRLRVKTRAWPGF